MDLHGDFYSDAEQTAQVLRNLLDHSSSVAYCTHRIKRDGAIETLWLWSCGRNRSLRRLCGRRSTLILHRVALASARSTCLVIGEAARDWLRYQCHISC